MIKTDNRETFTVFSQYLAGTLMCKGFVLAGIDRKKNDRNGKNVFFFYDSPELQEAIREYKKAKQEDTTYVNDKSLFYRFDR